MELEEMQTVWSQMSDQIEKQKKLTDKMIIMMTQEQYRKKLNKIAYPEMIGAIICYSTVILILINLNKLDNWYTLLSGLISIVILLVLPVLSLKSINQMRKVNIAGNNYKETLIEYSKGKKRFQVAAKIGFYMGFILMFVILPVTTKILNNKDLFSGTKSIWPMAIAIPFAIVIFIAFSRWVGKCYTNNINSAELLFKELEDNDISS
jgi:NADH:ubiquinone oxidoreductase subunit 6 (subunit J)